MEREMHPGEIYRYVTGQLYQIVAVARHWENGEPMVVYQALYGDFGVYVRPWRLFAGEAEGKEKADGEQTHLFERIELEAPQKSGRPLCESGEAEMGEAPTPNPEFLRFLEADTYEKKMECLGKLASTATQQEMDSIYLVLDMKPEGGTIREQAEAAARCLTMQNRFDGNRLR